MSVRVLPLLCVVAALSVQAGAETPKSRVPRPSDKSIWSEQAAGSLTHEARSLCHRRSGSTPARVGRTLALLQYARRLCPSETEVNRQLIDLYEGTGNLNAAAVAAGACVKAFPNDYACAIRWIRLTLQGLNTAEKRVDFLKTVAENKKLSNGIRAAAAVGLCRIYRGQGLKQKARQAAKQALRFDAHEPAALQMLAEITKRTAPVDMFETALGVFGSNPRSLYVSRNLAQTLQAAGLYDKSLLFYDHTLAVARTVHPPDDETEALLVGYFNAMLDAGKAEKAITLIAPYLKRYRRSLKLQGLMVEACRFLSRDEAAAAHVGVMADIYKPLTSPALKRSGPANAELAWFDLAFRSRPGDAIRWANAAALSAGDNLFVQRVLGAAELATGKVDSGAKRLIRLVKKDQYAAAILAGHYYRSGAPEKGEKTLLDGAGDIRTGPAWRALKKLADERKVKLPPVSYGKKMQSALDKLPAYLLEMGRHPEKFISVKLTAKKTKVLLGEAVTVTVTVRNISKHPVPLGMGGLFNPSIFLSVSAEGPSRATLPNLTLMILPAPKYLKVGKEVSQTIRVDVGELEDLLAAWPMAEVKLSISALLDPLQDGKKLFSSVPGIKIAPVTIRRAAMFDVSGGEKSAGLALGYIVRDLKQGSPARQMRAARQTASLLGYVCRSETGKAKPVLPKVLTRPILLRMTKEFLESPSPVVRAEMLAALHQVDLNAQIISLMAPCIQDADSMVRMRLIELLAVKRTRGHRTLLDHFAADSDELVREMAKTLRKK